MREMLVAMSCSLFEGFEASVCSVQCYRKMTTEQLRARVLVRRVYSREVEDGGLRGDRVQRLLPSPCGPSREGGDGTQIL